MFVIFIPQWYIAQTFHLNNQESSLTVLGTSSLHDWELKAENKSGKIAFKNQATGAIETCYLEIVAESLKSGKKSMEKNTYRALKTEDYKVITFQMTDVEAVNNIGADEFHITCFGDLIISGVKNRISLDFKVNIIENEIRVLGEKSIKMTDFNVDPPKALLGTIKTGDEVKIKFSVTFQ